MFGEGPLAREVARRVRAVGAAIDCADTEGPAHPWACALVSLEALASQPNLVVDVFGVVNRLVASRSRWGGEAPTVVVLSPEGGGAGRAGDRLARTLGIFLGDEAKMVVMKAPEQAGPDAMAEATDRAIALLSGIDREVSARLW